MSIVRAIREIFRPNVFLKNDKIIHHSSFTIHHSPFTIYHSSFTIHHSSFTIHHSSFTIHHSSFTIHHSSFIIHHSSFIIHHSSFTIPQPAEFFQPYQVHSPEFVDYFSLEQSGAWYDSFGQQLTQWFLQK